MVVRQCTLDVDAAGVAVITLTHPPVNALHPQGASQASVAALAMRAACLAIATPLRNGSASDSALS